MTAHEVKDALRRRHPTDSNNGGMVGEWTCIEEWRGIDLLALSAWQRAHVIGYEVKVSRSDMRRELLRPDKRADAVAHTTEFYFAVPAGLLTDEEVAYSEPGFDEQDFVRARCPGIPAFGPPGHRTWRRDEGPRFGGECQGRWRTRGKITGPYTVPVPVPAVVAIPDYIQRHLDETDELWAKRLERELRYQLERAGTTDAECPTCGGRGYVERSRVEAEAPVLWVPNDVGLVTVSSRGCRVVKRSPRRKEPKPLAATRKQLNDLVRWVSHRPDPRHQSQPVRAEVAA